MKSEHDYVPVPDGGPQEEGGVCVKCGVYASEDKDNCVPVEGDDATLIECPDCSARIRLEYVGGHLHRVVHLRHVI